MSRGDYRRPGSRSESGDNTFAEVVNSFSFDSGRKRKRRQHVEEPEPQPEKPAEALAVDRDRTESEPDDQEVPVASSVRSYTWTGGRTRSSHQLELETLVSTSDAYRPGMAVRLEHQSIAELCQHPRSVAEVGALLSVPIGVARVLLADMAELGLITVHQTVSESGSAPHLVLMERVLSGLRRL
jgi:hypothetical protein